MEIELFKISNSPFDNLTFEQIIMKKTELIKWMNKNLKGNKRPSIYSHNKDEKKWAEFYEFIIEYELKQKKESND